MAHAILDGQFKTAEEYLTKRKAHFDEAFTNPVTKQLYDMPPRLRAAAERICVSYNIRGICDPMYIANTIAMETGVGDGASTFRNPLLEVAQLILARLDLEASEGSTHFPGAAFREDLRAAIEAVK